MVATNAYATLDFMRPNQTLYDITNNFNGRVGDSESYAKIWAKSDGKPLDFTSGKSLGFYGIDPNGTPFQILGTARADQPGDNLQAGRQTFYFPAQTFQVSGDWDDESTFFAVMNENGDRISSVNVHMHVLDDKVTMGINSGPYISDLEAVKQEMLDWIALKKTDINGMIDSVTNKDSLLNQTLASIDQQLTAYQAAIKGDTFIDTGTYDASNKITGSSVNDAPSVFMATYPGRLNYRYYDGATIGLTNQKIYLVITLTSSSSVITGAPLQLAYDVTAGSTADGYKRVAKDANTWGSWSQSTDW